MGSSKSRDKRSTQKCAGHSLGVTKAMSPTYLWARRVVLLDQHPWLTGKLASWNRFHDNLMCHWSDLAKKEPVAVCLLLVWTLGQKHPSPPTVFFHYFLFYYSF